jgi:hypothetical protein
MHRAAIPAARDSERAMTRSQRIEKPFVQRTVFVLAMFAVAASMTACSHAMMMIGKGAKRPAAAEFGLGPRTSAQGRYVATLAPERPLRTRQLQTVRVVITDPDGQAIEGATLTIDGGMPQHGHGLPTRPRVTQALGNGAYQIDGVRFNMGGWWEFKVTITANGSADTVTFNLEL